MALTTQQFLDWLENPKSIKCTLVEVVANTGVSEQTFYLSNRNYTTKSSEVPSSTTYLPILQSSVAFTESLSLDGTASLSYGDIEVINYNGEYDIWSTYVWVGRAVNVYMGDVTAPRADFTKIFTGILEDISFKSKDTINLSLRDIIQRLNTPVTDTLLGPYGTKAAANQNKDVIRPVLFGEVHNITPLLIDDVLLDYMVHNGPIERIIEVRDNGVPVLFTANLTNGTFRLTYPPIGTITCSAQGDKFYVDATGTTLSGYVNTIPKLIQRIISGYGKPSDAILGSEMDLAVFEALSIANPQPAGIYISDRDNIISVCQELATSIGMQLIASRTGLLKLVKLDLPVTDGNSLVITENDILKDSLSIISKVPVVASVKIGYCKNWTLQPNLLTGIPEEHKDLYSQEYLIKTVTDVTTKTMYKLSADPQQKNTLLISNSATAVETEATRILNIFKTPRFIFRLECISKILTVKLGDMVKLYHSRFGLTGGKSAQVTSVAIDWDTGRTILEVLV